MDKKVMFDLKDQDKLIKHLSSKFIFISRDKFQYNTMVTVDLDDYSKNDLKREIFATVIFSSDSQDNSLKVKKALEKGCIDVVIEAGAVKTYFQRFTLRSLFIRFFKKRKIERRVM